MILMKIIAISQLKSFWQTYPDSEQQLRAWVDEVKRLNGPLRTVLKASIETQAS